MLGSKGRLTGAQRQQSLAQPRQRSTVLTRVFVREFVRERTPLVSIDDVTPFSGGKVDVVALNKRIEARAKAMVNLEEEETLTRPKVKIHVHKQVGLGESWKLVGKVPELGRFKPETAPYLRWANGHVWTYEGRLRPGSWQYKLVLKKPDGAYVWEEGPDRVLEVPAYANGNMTLEIKIDNVKLPA